MYSNGTLLPANSNLLITKQSGCYAQRRQNPSYHFYSKNRKNHIFEMTSSEMNDTIGIYEMSSNEAKETFGEDGTCFFIVSNAPQQQRTRVATSYIEHTPQQIITTTPPIGRSCGVRHYVPYQSYKDILNKNIRVDTKEHSLSSGVGSEESSEIDSPNPSNFTSSEAEFKPQCCTCHKINFDCTCGLHTDSKIKSYKSTSNSFSSPSTSSRRDSGFSSSIASLSPQFSPSRNNDASQIFPLRTINDSRIPRLSPLRTNNISQTQQTSPLQTINGSHTPQFSLQTINESQIPQLSPLRTMDKSQNSKFSDESKILATSSPCENSPLRSKIDYKKEILLCRIKQTLCDPEKEQLVDCIKQVLLESGVQNFADHVTRSNWEPLRKLPARSSLKKHGTSLIEEIKNRRFEKAMQYSRKEKQLLCTLKRCEIVKIIQQVRECLKYTRSQPPLECKFQVHRKIKLRQFPQYAIDVKEQNTKVKQNDLKCAEMKRVAGKGNIEKVLNLMKNNSCDHSTSACHEMSAVHSALQKEHYRTAILLFEAGTNIKEYTEQRVEEFHTMMDLVNRHKHCIP